MARHGGQIIAKEVLGGEERGEMINLIGLIIASHFDVYKVMSMQVATQAMLFVSCDDGISDGYEEA